MYLREINPSPVFTQIIRLYRIIDFEFPDNCPIPPKAYTPRPEHCLQFFPTPTIIDYKDHDKSTRPKNALLIGQHTITNNRTVFKKFLSLQIVFQPGALHRLLGIPMSELTNHLTDAEAVFGQGMEQINDQLYHAKTHQEMIVIAERHLLPLVSRVRKPEQAIDQIAQQMFDQLHSLDWYISKAYLCHRQFDRKFIDRIGIGPKEYMRVVRFDKAYRMKNNHPEMSWFKIAIACGYYDYQHLSKDYQTFTSYSPTAFFILDSPERLLGTEEVY